MYLSGALYSGNTAVAVIKINDEVLESLPQKARENVFQKKSSGERMLPLFEWAIDELNVPIYPELRVFKQLTRKVCDLSKNKSQVKLIIRERPAVFDGSYQVTQMNCVQFKE